MVKPFEVDEKFWGQHPSKNPPTTVYIFYEGEFLPVRNLRGEGRRPRWPIDRLRIGESFFIPGYDKPLGAIYERGKALALKIAQRVVTEQGQQGIRVWNTGYRKANVVFPTQKRNP